MRKRLYFIIPVLTMAVMASLLYSGVIQLNRPSVETFPVRGVDVSHYQGNVDWNVLQNQGIMFAYIKATEGSSHEDGAFKTNWKNIESTDLRAGAYHFFSFESPGLKQAENYIGTVSTIDKMLPPAIDIEPYGSFKAIEDIPNVVSEISDWLNAVESEYGIKPVIYTTEAFYQDCIAEAFPNYDIWIRSVYQKPSKSIQWTFWQYSNRVRLRGYDGEERFIDMNAFCGTDEDFKVYGRKQESLK